MAIFERRPSNVLAAALALAALASASVAGQSRNVETRTAARTPWGDPDLQGVWSIATITPFERPVALADKAQLTEQEAAAAEETFRKTQNQDRRDGAGTDADVALAYNDFWWDRGTKVASTRQTSLVVDPPDGRVPALTPEGQKRATERAARGYDSWQDRSLWERCITRGLPMIPGPYNNNYQILQTPGYVVILHEMIHDARIIPLDRQPHIGKNIRQWFGDSRGKWEGDTLVVDTTNFRRQGQLSRIDGRPAPHRALHAHQRRNGPIRVHDRRPHHVHETVDHVDSDAAHRRADLRVRLPRGELRHGQPSEWRPRAGEGGRGKMNAAAPLRRYCGGVKTILASWNSRDWCRFWSATSALPRVTYGPAMT